MNTEDIKYCQDLEDAIDWLYHQDASLFLCGEIIEVHTAKEFLDSLRTSQLRSPKEKVTLERTWKHIVENIKPMIEDRKHRRDWSDDDE